MADIEQFTCGVILHGQVLSGSRFYRPDSKPGLEQIRHCNFADKVSADVNSWLNEGDFGTTHLLRSILHSSITLSTLKKNGYLFRLNIKTPIPRDVTEKLQRSVKQGHYVIQCCQVANILKCGRF
jgi:hypothetical protein